MKITDERIKSRVENGMTVALRCGASIIRVDSERYKEIVEYKTEEYFLDWHFA